MSVKSIYLAGGLFNAADRLHNLFLEKHLVLLGYEVVFPQRQALRFFDGDRFDIAEIVNDCQRSSTSAALIYVGNADGPDADGGTCVEYGMAIVATKRAIVYRTDFRTAEDRELGVNAMFKAHGTEFVYHPCFFTELAEVEQYYESLAQKIHEAILRVFS